MLVLQVHHEVIDTGSSRYFNWLGELDSLPDILLRRSAPTEMPLLFFCPASVLNSNAHTVDHRLGWHSYAALQAINHWILAQMVAVWR
jgi:hypothetical protein